MAQKLDSLGGGAELDCGRKLELNMNRNTFSRMITEIYKYILNTSGFTLELPLKRRLIQDKSHCAVKIPLKLLAIQFK